MPTALPASPPFIDGGTAIVRQIIDGHRIALADGRQVVLVDIDVPLASPARGDYGLAARAKSALDEMLAGRSISLRFSGTPRDRYGRVLAQIFVADRWVQGALLRDGLARVHGFADDRIGLKEMLAIEDEARQARRGLWARSFYAVRDPAATLRDAGSFQLVEGTVQGAAKASGAVYVNFGPDWHTAFSLRIDGDALKLFRITGPDPMKLIGARVRVRGFIEGGARPLMEIGFPEQLELLSRE